MSGYSTDPEAAIRRYAQFDPEGAREMYSDLREHQLNQAEAARQEREANLERDAAVVTRLGQMYANSTPETLGRVNELASRYISAYGGDPASYNLPQSVDDVERFVRSTLSGEDRYDVALGERRMSDREEQTDIAGRRAAAYESSVGSQNQRRDFQNVNDAANTARRAAETHVSRERSRDPRSPREGWFGEERGNEQYRDGQTAGNGRYVYRTGRGWIDTQRGQ
jgi:hypothetical protein